jgi:peptidoglycan-associated lipoprotein
MAMGRRQILSERINNCNKERVMKKFTSAGKALSIIFAVLWMAGCASTDTTTSTADADAAAAEARAAEQARKEAQMQAEKEREMARMKALEDAVAAAGNVVYFDFDKSTLTPATRRVLDAHVALAKAKGRGSMRLEGHADERGTREYNMALGERRAKAVKDYMSVNGVSGSRMETISYGEERPAVAGTGEAAWSRNRRVEIK